MTRAARWTAEDAAKHQAKMRAQQMYDRMGVQKGIEREVPAGAAKLGAAIKDSVRPEDCREPQSVLGAISPETKFSAGANFALRLDSVANLREHWSKRAKRTHDHRVIGFVLVPEAKLPCIVTITRIAPRPLDDDNLCSACKALRDGIADRLGVKDNDPRVTWLYAQERGKPKEYGVRIDVQEV